MKNSITAIMLLLLLSACKKKNDLEPAEKTIISGQVFLYGANTPISGATIITKKCIDGADYYCTKWDQKTSVSATDGSFTVQRDYIENIRVHSPGYWTYIEDSDSWFMFDGSTTPRGSMQHFYDQNWKLQKIALGLLPEVKLNVHVKNTSAISDSISVYLVAEGQLGHGITASLIYLRKGIDTTFEYTAFGNLNNRIFIKKGLGWVAMDTTISSKEVFLSAGSNTSLAINF